MHTFNRFFLLIALMTSLLTSVANAQLPVSPHKVFINGKQLTGNTAALDILGDGTMSYDVNSRTLTLNGTTLTNTGKTAAIEFKDSDHDYRINLIGNNTISTAGGGISMLCNLKIDGSGKLKCTSTNNKSTGIWVRNGKTLSIHDCSLTLDGNNGISGTSFLAEKLLIDNATVTASGHQSENGYGGAGIRQFSQITLQNCDITAPHWADFDARQCAIALDGTICGTVTIKPAILYGVWVKDKRVSSNNATDVMNDGGTVTFNADNNTLTLKDATINYQNGNKVPLLFNGDSDYTLALQGDNRINTAKGAITTWNNLNINGGGHLDCKSSNNTHTSVWVCNAKTLTIDHCSLAIQGWKGIAGTNKKEEHLLINAARVQAKGIAPAEGQRGTAISQFSTLVLQECEIISPAGAKFDAELGGIALDGQLCLETKIEQVHTGIAPSQSASPTIVAIYNPMGHLLNNMQPGVNIVKMSDKTIRKILKK